MTRLYSYVGPPAIRELAARAELGLPIATRAELQRQVAELRDSSSARGELTVTFVIDAEGRLRIADRHSEHVACAGGECVRCAGEMTFGSEHDRLAVVNITNQSTGYCPEPESWLAVKPALDALEIGSPAGFSPAFIFRRCVDCGQSNVVKDDWFVCAICGAKLPATWNFASHQTFDAIAR